MSIAIVIGKLIAFFLHFIRSSATALPGLVILKLKPDFISALIKQNKLKSIVITGTNGKTTTCRLITSMFDGAKMSYITNRTGSNLLRGIASTLINQSNLLGKLNSTLAVWEADEAAFAPIIKALRPSIVLFTNLSRDQLDRYGEINTLLKLWQKNIAALPANTQIVLNQTDPLLIKLHFPKIIHFGQNLTPGQYQLHNIEAAKTIGRIFKLKPEIMATAIAKFQPAFGRGEELKLNGHPLKILLVKNPAGFNSVWEMLHNQNKLDQPLLIILNDKIADGTDVSWIYDVDFNYLKQRKTPIIVSGTRALDMALRLKIAGLSPSRLILEVSIKKALGYSPKIILPTYTAMLALRKIILKQKFD